MLNAIENLKAQLSELKADAETHGSAFAQVNTGERAGVSLEFVEGHGWHATEFTKIDTKYTDEFPTPEAALEALEACISTDEWYLIRY